MSSVARVLLLVVSLAAGCGGPRSAEPSSPPAVANTGGTLEPAPPAGSDPIVIARIVGSGPIGDGACSQRSYEIAVDKVISGDLAEHQLWVHFEACGDARAAASFGGTGLDDGATYELTLRRGASANFGGYMIMNARRP